MKKKENSPKVKAFIRKNAWLFWYTPEKEKENISHELLVEHTLKYGNALMIKELFDLLGLNYVAEIFRKQTAPGSRLDYSKPTKNFFELYFNRHAPGNTHRRTA